MGESLLNELSQETEGTHGTMQENGARNKASAATRLWRKLWNSPQPTLGVEISTQAVSVGRWSSKSAQIETSAWKSLPDGAVEASPLRENIQRPEEVQQALSAAFSSLGILPGSAAPANSSKRPADVVLVIPDQAARLFVLHFDTFPEKPREARPLVQWRLKKSVPFEIESAALSYFVRSSGNELQVVAVTTPQSILRQYETVAEDFGFRPRWVTLSTLASLGLAETAGLENGSPGGHPAPQSEGPDGKDTGLPGVLVAKYSPPGFTTAILQGGHLRLFRTAGVEANGEGLLSPADVLEVIYPSVVYFQDNFKGSLKRAYLCGLGENSAAIAESLEGELYLETAPLVPEQRGGSADADRGRWERHFAALLGIAREQTGQ